MWPAGMPPDIMVPQGSGLIAFGSSFGANCYMHGPGYGAQKAGIDKFAHDMQHDLSEYGRQRRLDLDGALENRACLDGG
jgi:NADP-dependent 3-hydroxy acid dehydrogenase YdfG